MKRFFKTCQILIAALLLTGCTAEPLTPPAEPPAPGVTEPATQETGGDIILIAGHANYAWGYDHRGCFVDSLGKVYHFSLGELHVYDLLEEEPAFADKLELFRRCTAPIDDIGEEAAAELAALGKKVDPDARTIQKAATCDYGTDYVRFRDPETGELVDCAISGDTDLTILDRNANKLEKRWQAIAKALPASDAPAPILYPVLDCPEAEVPLDGAKLDGRYMLFSDAQLRDLAAASGLPLDGILDRMAQSEYAQYMADRYVYFVDLTGSAKPDGLLRSGDAFGFVHLGETAGNYGHITMLPKDECDFFSTQYTGLTGGEWQLPQANDPNADPETHRGCAEELSDAAAGELYQALGCHKYKGLFVDNQADYDAFAEACDAAGLAECSVRDLLEQGGAPDFAEQVLCVRIDRRTAGSTYREGRILIAPKSVTIGLRLEEPQEGQLTDSALVWLWLPRRYLPEVPADDPFPTPQVS